MQHAHCYYGGSILKRTKFLNNGWRSFNWIARQTLSVVRFPYTHFDSVSMVEYFETLKSGTINSINQINVLYIRLNKFDCSQSFPFRILFGFALNVCVCVYWLKCVDEILRALFFLLLLWFWSLFSLPFSFQFKLICQGRENFSTFFRFQESYKKMAYWKKASNYI